MTATVAEQTAYLALQQTGVVVAEQTAYVAMLPDGAALRRRQIVN